MRYGYLLLVVIDVVFLGINGDVIFSGGLVGLFGDFYIGYVIFGKEIFFLSND